jgi:hypothetical protein
MGSITMQSSHRNYRPRSVAAAARLSETQLMLRNLKRREFTDEAVAAWLDIDQSIVAALREGRVCPTPTTLASLRRFVKVARHGR